MGRLTLGLMAIGLGGCAEALRVPSTIQAVFDPQLGSGFWSMPWPADNRLQAHDGGVGLDLTGFPNPSENPLLNSYLALAETELSGFGLNAPIYLPFDGAIALPEMSEDAVRASLDCQGPIRIVDVDVDSDHYGQCHPARWTIVSGDSVDPYVQPHLVAVAPYWGFPLREGTTYAVYLVDAQDDQGKWLQASPLLESLLNGTSTDTALQPAFRPLSDYLASEPMAVGAEGLQWIAHASVFTTQSEIHEMESLADFIRSNPSQPSWQGELALVAPEHPAFQQEYAVWDGAYTAHNFQRGVVPYASEGGGFEWKAGVPVPQTTERIPFAIGMPRVVFEQPEAGWPLIIHAHGTGGDRFSHLTGGSRRPGLLGAARGMMSLSIPQPFHGDRWEDGTDTAITLYSFNYFNPESGRSTFRQGALDIVSAVEFATRYLADGGPIAEAHPGLRIDPDSIFFVGHSQGGLTGAMALPFTKGIRGWVFSGAGGGLSVTAMQREDPLVIRDAIATALDTAEGTELFVMHPLLAMVQTLAEVTDPINYAPRWVVESEGEPVSVLLTQGMHDAQTPADTAEALAVAGRLPIARPYSERGVLGLELRELDRLDTAYSANTVHPDGTAVTTGLAQFDTDHFAIFNTGDAALLWSNFLYSIVRDGSPGELGGDFP
ncbi:MAG: hypothetical protein CL928_13505 [Deltaproteobacteria bacterium]|nr:hypothetical protein [Deltaproteobacteria bacterium]